MEQLIDLNESDKAVMHPSGYGVRAAYQTPTNATVGTAEEELLANTFEDALFYRNLDFFKGRKGGTGLAGAFKNVAESCTSGADLLSRAREEIASGNKAEFALDLLYSDDVEQLEVPEYIAEGLLWLIAQLKRKEEELAPQRGCIVNSSRSVEVDNLDAHVDEEEIRNCLSLEQPKSFFLFAGAGSGKTRSLVNAVDFVAPDLGRHSPSASQKSGCYHVHEGRTRRDHPSAPSSIH